MSDNTKIELIPAGNTPQKIETSIAEFNEPLSNLLRHVGLPTENVLQPIEERRKVIFSLNNNVPNKIEEPKIVSNFPIINNVFITLLY